MLISLLVHKMHYTSEARAASDESACMFHATQQANTPCQLRFYCPQTFLSLGF